MAKKPAEHGRTKPFAAFLQEVSGGRCTKELAETLQEVIQAVELTGKAGAVTLKLTFTPKKTATHLEVDYTITPKIPVNENPMSLFFVDADHNLVRDDPRQGTIPGLGLVPGDPAARIIGEIRDEREQAENGE